ncbi:hypothetical protein IE02_2952 [Fibrobacter succinogenes subsp. elongatus]|uniref:Uncharacterized protein n=1 Tax=Fibrobacter succinogenes TaxID=833 RepID=A0A380S8F0_FIBSU|nr:hypothetical protein IE02_2952 [Fibrobacter succinogenes subsp. elongatus]SUQ26142.1 hypothetical protein SAMN05661053_2952 [Fibrobacter succinogenes]
MAGGLFVFVRTAPPGGCALAITAGQYRPPMAHCPLSKRSGGPFFLCRSALLQDGTPSSPRSRGHGVLVHAACRSRPLPEHGERGFFVLYVPPAQCRTVMPDSDPASAYKSRYCIHITLCCLCFFVRMPVALETAPLCGPAIFEY